MTRSRFWSAVGTLALLAVAFDALWERFGLFLGSLLLVYAVAITVAVAGIFAALTGDLPEVGRVLPGRWDVGSDGRRGVEGHAARQATARGPLGGGTGSLGLSAGDEPARTVAGIKPGRRPSEPIAGARR